MTRYAVSWSTGKDDRHPEKRKKDLVIQDTPLSTIYQAIGLTDSLISAALNQHSQALQRYSQDLNNLCEAIAESSKQWVQDPALKPALIIWKQRLDIAYNTCADQVAWYRQWRDPLGHAVATW